MGASESAYNQELLSTDGRRGISRREFLRRAGVVLAGAAVAGSLRTSEITPAKKEKELHDLGAPVAQLDFAPSYQLPQFIQEDFPDNEKLLRELLGSEQYISKATRVWAAARHSLEKVFRGEKAGRLQDFIVQKFGFLGLQSVMLDVYGSHGVDVSEQMLSTWEKLGCKARIRLAPLQGLYTTENVQTGLQYLHNNPGFSLTLRASDVIPLVQQSVDENSTGVINFSFQLGEIRIFLTKSIQMYDYQSIEHEKKDRKLAQMRSKPSRVAINGQNIDRSAVPEEQIRPISYGNRTIYMDFHDRPQILIEGAYTGEKALNNVRELCLFAKAFPQQLLIAAGGNYGDDLRAARTALAQQGEWPSNLLIAGQWDGHDTAVIGNNQTHGADIYVPESLFLEGTTGTSIATAYLSALAGVLFEKGLSVDQMKQALLNCCTNQTYTAHPNFRDPLQIEKIERDGEQAYEWEETAAVFDQHKFDALLELFK